MRWVIVDNGSSDATRAVAGELAERYEWIVLLSLPGAPEAVRGGPIVRAFQAGLAALPSLPDVVLNVDADVSMDADYFERLLDKFVADPTLGIAGGSGYELSSGVWRQRHLTGSTVWGASRAYRRECLQQVFPLEERLGWDGIDEMKANARGWQTRTFLDIPFRHHRREGERDRGRWPAAVAQGRAAHFMGYRAWYLVLRSIFNTIRNPAALGMIWGFVKAGLERQPRFDDEAARNYLRRQQSPGALLRRAREALRRRESCVGQERETR